MKGYVEMFLQVSVLLMVFTGSVYCCRGGTLLSTGIIEGEKTLILDTHNKLRASVAMGRIPGQPGAENMREIVWDEELAAKAQEWANQCTFKHDPHRKIDRFTMGQNMAIIWSTAELADDDGDFPSRIQNWFNEVQKYAFGASWSPRTGHYSQLVWGETSLIGCGFSYYKTASRYNKLYVCNYGPGGNVVGSDPYQVGKPSCNNHGMYPSFKYQGLCSAPGTGVQRNTIQSTNSYKESSKVNTKSAYDSQQEQVQQPQEEKNSFRSFFKTTVKKNGGISWSWSSKKQYKK